MVTRRLLTLFFLFFSIVCFAQTKYEPGYVVVNPSDTLKGYINNKDWDISPTQVAFKKDLSQEEKIFTAEQVSAFYIETGRLLFESHPLKLLMVTSDLYASVPNTYVEQKEFIERIWTNGVINLYRGKSSQDQRERFFIKQPDRFYELVNFKYNKIKDGQHYSVTVDEYKDQLAQLTAGTPGFSATIPTYFASRIIRYLNAYNEKITGHKQAEQSAERGMGIYVGIGAGIERLNSYDLLRKDNDVTAGLSFRVNLPRNYQRSYVKASYFRTFGMYYHNRYTEKGLSRPGGSLEMSVGTYIGLSSIQPFVSVGLGHYWISAPASNQVFYAPYRYTILQPSAGISYKKRLELEVSHFSRLFFNSREGAPFFIQPRISLNYYIKIK